MCGDASSGPDAVGCVDAQAQWLSGLPYVEVPGADPDGGILTFCGT